MEILKPVIDSKTAESLLGIYLRSCQEQVSFLTQDANEGKSLITTINCKLNEPSTRFVGLSLLHTYLQSCPQNTVIENAISWMSLCVKGTVSPVPSTCNLSYQVLSCLFCRCADHAKHVASAVLPRLFEHLQSVPQHCIPSALNCLESCMKIYSGSCGPHKNLIQKFLIPLLEFKGPNKAAVVWKACVCLALVPQIGGGGAGGATHQENWTKQLKVACSTLHEILDVLFSSVHELEVYNLEATREETFPFGSTEDEDPISKAYILAARFEGIVCCVQAMLLGEFGVVKNVPPSAVLSVICRGLAVTSVSLQNTSTTESLVLLTLLPTLQTKLFELMRALIDCCGPNLLPFGRLVVKLVLQTLKWTYVKDWKHKITKPYRFLRTAAYGCMKHWLDCVRTIPTCEEIAEIVEMACSDFQSEEDGLRLLAGKKKSKYGDRNEAKRKRASAGPSNTEVDNQFVDTAANKQACIAALQTVQALLAVHGWALNRGSYSTLNETAVKLVLSISCQPHSPTIPYGEADARLELYRLLSSLVMHPHPNVAAPIRMAWKLFSVGQNDPNLQVSTFCCEALSNLEKIIHPSFVPLALPILETEEDKDASDNLFVATAFGENNDTKAVDAKDEVTHKNKKNRSPSKQTLKKTVLKPEEVSEKSKDDMKATEEQSVNLEDTPPQEKVSNGVDQEMIDVSDSGSNGEDIEEVPVEINLADSEASVDGDEPATIRSEVTDKSDGIEIIDEISGSCADFRLAISPEPAFIDGDTDGSRCQKRRNESVQDESIRDEPKEKRIVTNSSNGSCIDVPLSNKQLVVASDTNDEDSDLNAMLACFVDKTKPMYDYL